MGELKQQEESARLQWESMRDDYRALHQKNQELLTEKMKLFAANHKLEEENNLLIGNVKKMYDLGIENADLQRKIIAIKKEKEDLWNELQAVKAEVRVSSYNTNKVNVSQLHSIYLFCGNEGLNRPNSVYNSLKFMLRT